MAANINTPYHYTTAVYELSPSPFTFYREFAACDKALQVELNLSLIQPQ